MFPAVSLGKTPRWVTPGKVFAGSLRRILRDMARFHLALGGDTGLRLGPDPDSARERLERAITALVRAGLPKNPKRHWLTVEVDHRYRVDGWSLNVRLEPQSYFVMGVDFLDSLKKRKPAFYRLVRSLLQIIASMSPTVTSDDIHDDFFEDYLMMLEDESDEDKELAQGARAEHTAFTAHLKRRRFPRHKVVRWVRNARRRLHSMKVTKAERRWVECGLDVLLLQGKPFPILTDGRREEDSERVFLGEFFGIFWNPDSWFSEMAIDRTLNMAMEYGGPVVVLEVRKPKDLKLAGECVRFINFLGEFFYQGYMLWNSKKR